MTNNEWQCDECGTEFGTYRELSVHERTDCGDVEPTIVILDQ